MFEASLSKVQDKLAKWANVPLTLQGKIVVANHLVMSSLWYMLTLNCSNDARLKSLQQLTIKFVWGSSGRRSRHRVSSQIICLPKSKGGLGLINIPSQAKALGLRIFHWSIQPGLHPLQLWIKRQLRCLSQSMFGIDNFGCLFSSRSTSNSFSEVLLSPGKVISHSYTSVLWILQIIS
jgi:hypothetical protein